jgi:tetrahydromethanopterin S-methyltransferase subunit C
LKALKERRKIMSITKPVVAGIYSSRSHMEQGFAALRTGGFGSAHISVIYPEHLDSKEVAQAKSDNTQMAATIGGGTGVVVGGTLGLLAGVVAMAIPGVGAFWVAGPIVAALAGAGVGGVLGEVTGALVGMGVSETKAKRYEGRIKAGEILVAVHSETAESLQRAKEILCQTGAQDVTDTEENRLKEMADVRANRDVA